MRGKRIKNMLNQRRRGRTGDFALGNLVKELLLVFMEMPSCETPRVCGQQSLGARGIHAGLGFSVF